MTDFEYELKSTGPRSSARPASTSARVCRSVNTECFTSDLVFVSVKKIDSLEGSWTFTNKSAGTIRASELARPVWVTDSKSDRPWTEWATKRRGSGRTRTDTGDKQAMGEHLAANAAKTQVMSLRVCRNKDQVFCERRKKWNRNTIYNN